MNPITDIEIRSLGHRGENFSLDWNGSGACFHIWLTPGDLANPNIDELSDLWKNPPRDTPTSSPAFYFTRRLNPAARANRETVAFAMAYANEHKLLEIACEARRVERNRQEATRIEEARINRIKDHAEELLRSLTRLHNAATDPDTMGSIPYEITEQSMNAIKAATA